MIADIPASVWVASIAAMGSIATTIIGVLNRRKLNGLMNLYRTVQRIEDVTDRIDREFERHQFWHLTRGDKEIN